MAAVAVGRSLTTLRSQAKNRLKGNVIASTVTFTEVIDGSKAPTSDHRKSGKAGCLCCASSHLLEEGRQFKEKNAQGEDAVSEEKGSVLCMLKCWSYKQCMRVALELQRLR